MQVPNFNFVHYIDLIQKAKVSGNYGKLNKFEINYISKNAGVVRKSNLRNRRMSDFIKVSHFTLYD